jgi:hypothetical protein
MDEIVQLLQEKTGLSADESRELAQLLVDLIKSKVPVEFQGIVGSVLGGQTSADGQQAAGGAGIGGLLGELGGMFGGSKS